MSVHKKHNTIFWDKNNDLCTARPVKINDKCEYFITLLFIARSYKCDPEEKIAQFWNTIKVQTII